MGAVGWVEHLVRRTVAGTLGGKGPDPEITQQGTPYPGPSAGHFNSLCLSHFNISGKIRLLPRAEEGPGAILVWAQLPHPPSPLKPSPLGLCCRMFLSLLRQLVPSHPSPLGILLLTDPVLKPPAVSPASGQASVTDHWAPCSKLSRKVGFPVFRQCLHSILDCRPCGIPPPSSMALALTSFQAARAACGCALCGCLSALLSFISHACTEYISQ